MDATGIKTVKPVFQRPSVPAVLSEMADPGPIAPDGHTQAKAKVQHQIKVTPTALPPKKSRKKWLWGAAGVVVVLVATTTVLWVTGAFKSKPSATEVAPISIAASHITGQTQPTGLRIDLAGSQDSSTGNTLLTLTAAAAPSAGLKGDLLVVVPGLADSCPRVKSTTAQIQPLRASTDGVDVPCAHKISGVELRAGDTIDLPLDVSLNLRETEAEPPEDYNPWLNAIVDATDEAARQITGSSFPLQRVVGLKAEVEPITLTDVDGTLVPYKIQAEWSDGHEADPNAPLLTQDTIDGMETELLDNLTGGTGLDGIAIDTCDAVVRNGVRLLARQPTDDCHLQVKIGVLDTGQTRFSIAMRQ
jgi:hypothetical protein